MRVVSIGGGPAGLYYALLHKQRAPRDEVIVLERNREHDAIGFGVVFSDATLDNLVDGDPAVLEAIRANVSHWDEIDIHYRGEVLRSRGHGFAGLSRRTLLDLLAGRCRDLGVELRFEAEVNELTDLGEADLVLLADGVNSKFRERHADHFRPSIELSPNRFAWLGTTFPFEAFTFYFKADRAGLWRVHAYRYSETHSTFIVEATGETWARSGLAADDEDGTLRYFEQLFGPELKGHALLKNRSIWRSFPTVKNERWSHDHLVLLGDAAHTAHFSIGSGTKLAMEDAQILAKIVAEGGSIRGALEAYETVRRPAVEALQRAAAVSQRWFENTERYMGLEPTEFATSLLTRSLRVNYGGLKVRDPDLTRVSTAEFAARAARQSGAPVDPATPPMFTPLRLRELVLENRVVVSPMCMYSATDGTVDDFHLVHLGSRAMGGAGLVIAEMTDVSPEGRITPGCAGMYAEGHVGAWRRIVDFVHRHTPAKIGLQLGHAGRKGATRRPWEPEGESPLGSGGWPLLAPSPLPYASASQTPRAMVDGDFARVLADYVRATEMAAAAGFDLLELHSAHGYLLGSFLSPLTNRRTDGYGGDARGRMRFPLEVFRAIRARWPAERPISVRVSATDWAPGGIEMADVLAFARALKEAGADVIDVSTGQTVPEQRPAYGRLYQTPFAEHVRLEVGVPTMTVGAIQSHADVNGVLLAGRADLCVLARAHLYDPYWTRHAAEAQGFRMRWPDPYRVLSGYRPRSD